MVGSLDYFDKSIDGQVNVALASRQPGSSFKPYTYLTAFETGQLLARHAWSWTCARSSRTRGNPPYVPENYDRKYHGPQMLRWALQRSYNIPAVWLMDQVGVGNVIKTARRLGINSLNRELNSYGLSLTLGGGEVALLDHTYAFSVFANGGVMAGQPVPPEQSAPRLPQAGPGLHPPGAGQGRQGPGAVHGSRPPSAWWTRPPTYMLNNVLSDPAPAPGGLRHLLPSTWCCPTGPWRPRPAPPTTGWTPGPWATRRNWRWASGPATATTSR